MLRTAPTGGGGGGGWGCLLSCPGRGEKGHMLSLSLPPSGISGVSSFSPFHWMSKRQLGIGLWAGTSSSLLRHGLTWWGQYGPTHYPLASKRTTTNQVQANGKRKGTSSWCWLSTPKVHFSQTFNPFTPDLKKCILPAFQKAIVWVM